MVRQVMIILCLLLIVSLPTAAAPVPGTAAQVTPNTAGLVIQYPDGHVETYAVEFDEPSISALEALQRTGIGLDLDGELVCSIRGSGCPSSDCFCGCPPPFSTCYFWSYAHWNGRSWDFSAVGAGQYQLHDGDVDGFHWSESQVPGPHAYRQYAVERALDWLRTQQLPNGSFPGFGVGATVDAVLALDAANVDATAWRVGSGPTALDYLEDQAAAYATSAAATGKLILAVIGAGLDPAGFGGLDLLQTLAAFHNGSGQFGSSNWDQAYALLALRAARATPPAGSRTQLLNAQTTAGGWGFMPGDDPDIDSTGLILQALAAAGEPNGSPAVTQAVAFLDNQQNPDGGFAYQSPFPSNASSTALATLGLIAMANNPLGTTWTISNTTPLDYLTDQQSPLGGFAGYSGPNDLFATVSAIPALMGKPLPQFGTGVAKAQALTWLRTQQANDGSFGSTGQTVDAVYAVVAGGQDPAQWTTTGGSLMDYLAAQADTYTQSSAAAAGKLTLALLAAQPDQSPTNFGGVNVGGRVFDSYDLATGQFGSSVIDQAYGMLGYTAQFGAGIEPARARLTQLQLPNGGWEFATGFGADTNTTALAIQALAAAGEPATTPTMQRALQYLRTQQNPDAGFPYQVPCGYPGCDASDANSTAYVVQALTAAGENADGWAWSRHFTATHSITLTVQTPLDTLLVLQSDEGGFAGFSGPNDLYATLQAVPGVAELPQPMARRATLFYPYHPGVVQAVNRAGLVVQFGDGSVQTYCIPFTSPSITGYDLLQASGNLQVIYDTANSGLGASVCKINNDGCNFPLVECFCQCQGINCVYWSYFHLRGDNTWSYSRVGASSHSLQNGSVDGWRWGIGTLTTAPPPPVYTFDQLCSTTGTWTPSPTLSPTTVGTPFITGSGE